MQTRPAAEAAIENLNQSLLHGAPLKIGYGKPVQLPPQPVFPLPRHVQQIRNHIAGVVSNRGRDPRGEHSWGRGTSSDAEMHRVRSHPAAVARRLVSHIPRVHLATVALPRGAYTSRHALVDGIHSPLLGGSTL